VWFLAHTFGGPGVTRACSIPQVKALFFPVMNLGDVNVTNQTVAELRTEVTPCIDATTTLSVELSGKPVSNLVRRSEEGREKSNPFSATVPPGGFLAEGTCSPVVDDGFYVMLKPLPLGRTGSTSSLRVAAACSSPPRNRSRRPTF
jgi:hypothetical protein